MKHEKGKCSCWLSLSIIREEVWITNIEEDNKVIIRYYGSVRFSDKM